MNQLAFLQPYKHRNVNGENVGTLWESAWK